LGGKHGKWNKKQFGIQNIYINDVGPHGNVFNALSAVPKTLR